MPPDKSDISDVPQASAHVPAPAELLRAFRQMRHIMKPTRPIEDLKPSEYLLLVRIRHLGSDPGMKITELSSKLRVASPTVTQLVNALEARGLLERAKDDSDGRVVRIKLTAEGERIAQLAEDEVTSGIQGLIEHIGANRSLLLIQLLDEVYRYFELRSAGSTADESCNHSPKEGDWKRC